MASEIENKFQTGGSLPFDYPFYVKRQADKDLYEHLVKGDFCYVLTARQMGKSSLRVKTMSRLVDEGFACCSIDITKIGVNNIDTEAWYWSLVDIINADLHLGLDIAAWWEKEIKLSPVYRFFKFLKTVVLSHNKNKVIFFFDEIDSMLSLDRSLFNSDDFFASIRAIYNERADNPEFNRLNFVVIGVASPNELMNDVTRTPFNIGKSIQINNFTLPEAAPLAAGLKHLSSDPAQLLKEIFSWTNGQPILTQQLCNALANEPPGDMDIRSIVKKCITDIFLKRSLNDSSNSNLLNIQNRIVENDKYGMKMLQLYSSILKFGSITEDTSDIEQIYLKLTGLVHLDNGKLVVNNNIYKSKFNQAWIADTSSRMNRPYNPALKEWLDNNRAEDKAIRGAILDDFNIWCETRNDLTLEEKQFQVFSNAVEIRKEAEIKYIAIEKERETEEKKRLEAEKQKEIETSIRLNAEKERAIAIQNAQQSRRKYVLLLVAAILTLILFSVYAFNKLEQQKIEADKQEAKAAQVTLEAATKTSELLIMERNSKMREISSKRLVDSLTDRSKILNKTIELNKTSTNEKIKRLEELRQEITESENRNNESLSILLENQIMLLKKARENDSLQKIAEETGEYYRSVYQIEKRFPSASAFDSLEKSEIVKLYLKQTDNTVRENLINVYMNYVVGAIEMRKTNPNKAIWLLTEAEKNVGSSAIISKKMKDIIDRSIFYVHRLDLEPDSRRYLSPTSSARVPVVYKINENKLFVIMDSFVNIINSDNLQKDSFPIRDKIITTCFDEKEQLLFLVTKKSELLAYDFTGVLKYKKSLKDIPTFKARDENSIIEKIYFKSKGELLYYSSSDLSIYHFSTSSAKLVKKISLKGAYEIARDRFSQKTTLAPATLNFFSPGYNNKFNLFILRGWYTDPNDYNNRSKSYSCIINDRGEFEGELVERVNNVLSKYDKYAGFDDDLNLIHIDPSNRDKLYFLKMNGDLDSLTLPGNTEIYGNYYSKSEDNNFFVFNDSASYSYYKNEIYLYNKQLNKSVKIPKEDRYSHFFMTFFQNNLLVTARSPATSDLYEMPNAVRLFYWDYLNTDKSISNIINKYVKPFEEDFKRNPFDTKSQSIRR